MGLANRVAKLESAPGLCPACGKPLPISLVEVRLPGPPLAALMDHATADERAALGRIVSALQRRAGAAAEALEVEGRTDP